MHYVIRIAMDNEAFGDDPALELNRILLDLTERTSDGLWSGKLFDVNGNTVGTAQVYNE